MTIVIGSNQAHAYMKDADYCCTLPGCMSHGYGAVPMILEEPCGGGREHTKAQPQRFAAQQDPKYICVAIQGRDPQNPANRKTRGIKLEQMIEPRKDELTNTLTKVAKDNMVLIRQATQSGYAECNIGGGWQI